MGKLKIILWNIFQEIKYFFCPRDKSIVLIGGWCGKRFADNSRYLFQYLSENKKELGLTHVVWVTRNEKLYNELKDMGYEVYMMDSQESIKYHKTAAYHIICNVSSSGNNMDADLLTQYSNGAYKINLWHGLGGIKGVHFAGKEYRDYKTQYPTRARIKEFLRKFKSYRVCAELLGGWEDAYYLSTTPFETCIFQKYFKLPINNFVESGYPRNQKDIRLRKNEIEILEKIKQYKKVILYMPTFRGDNTHYTAPLTNDELIKTIEENGWLWIEKKHGIDQSNLLKEIISPAVLQLDPEFDGNVLFPYIDMVITDYSSVSWDALYHKKPVVFYMPDYDYYMKDDRGFVLQPEEFIIGPATYNINELIQLLNENKKDFSLMLPQNEDELFEKIWGEHKECAQIWNDIQYKMEHKK